MHVHYIVCLQNQWYISGRLNGKEWKLYMKLEGSYNSFTLYLPIMYKYQLNNVTLLHPERCSILNVAPS